MSIWANIFKSLDIGGPTYWDKDSSGKQIKKPPTGGLMGKLGVGQIEKNVKVGDTNLRFQAPDPRKEVDKKASMAAGELVYKPGKKFGQFHRIIDGKITLDQEAWKAQDFGASTPEKKSLVKETVDAEEDTEEEATVPSPPPPPEEGQTDNEESASSAEGDVKGGTVVADKNLDDSAIKPKVTLMSKYKKKKGLLANEDQTQMLT
tara:strand:- start:412 stop:1026 length:615 start_codon:yes stop_codon:yes gene_type:complete